MAKPDNSGEHDAETAKRLAWIVKAAQTPKPGKGGRPAKKTQQGRRRGSK